MLVYLRAVNAQYPSLLGSVRSEFKSEKIPFTRERW